MFYILSYKGIITTFGCKQPCFTVSVNQKNSDNFLLTIDTHICDISMIILYCAALAFPLSFIGSRCAYAVVYTIMAVFY